MASLFLVRHGQASFGADDYDQLSDKGVAQSRLLGDWLARTAAPAATVICGGMRRHRQTAEACLESWGATPLTIEEDASFNEFDHQDLLLRHRHELADPALLARQAKDRHAFQTLFSDSVARWVSGKHDGDYLESWPQFRARCVAGFLRAVARARENDVWVFSSGGAIGAITQHVLQVPDEMALELIWALYNASVTEFLCRPGRIRLSQFNTLSHLVAAREPGLISYR